MKSGQMFRICVSRRLFSDVKPSLQIQHHITHKNNELVDNWLTLGTQEVEPRDSMENESIETALSFDNACSLRSIQEKIKNFVLHMS